MFFLFFVANYHHQQQQQQQLNVNGSQSDMEICGLRFTRLLNLTSVIELAHVDTNICACGSLADAV